MKNSLFYKETIALILSHCKLKVNIKKKVIFGKKLKKNFMTYIITHHLGMLLLRLGFGGMMLIHGIPKLLKILSGDFSFGDPIGIGEPASLVLAVLGEVLFPILVIVGFKTTLAAIPIIITMIVAAFVVHAADPLGTKEMAILYLIGFVAIALLSAGKYSIDRK